MASDIDRALRTGRRLPSTGRRGTNRAGFERVVAFRCRKRGRDCDVLEPHGRCVLGISALRLASDLLNPRPEPEK